MFPAWFALERGARHLPLAFNRPDAWQTEVAVTHIVRPSLVKSQNGVEDDLYLKLLYANIERDGM